MIPHAPLFPLFFFNDTATTEIYTLSLHDALPISGETASVEEKIKLLMVGLASLKNAERPWPFDCSKSEPGRRDRSEEHTSELQSRLHLVCRLLLEKKKKQHERSFIWLSAAVRCMS